MRRVFLLLIPVAFINVANPLAASFSLGASQIPMIVPGTFNQLPSRVNISSNSPDFNLALLRVASDSSWVSPVIDTNRSQIILTFATSDLTSRSYTATITATQGATTNKLFVNATITPLSVTKLVDDPVRSRVYGINLNSSQLEEGSVIILDPITGNAIGSITVGQKPTDLAVSPDGTELLVINAVGKSLSVIDLIALELKETILLPAFDNWGADATTADIALGPNGIIYYTDGAWAPILRVLDRATGQVLQSVGIDSNGFGDFAVTSDGKNLIAWAQYGWSAGWVGSYIARFGIDPAGKLTFLEETNPAYPTILGRDPLDTPVLISNDDKRAFVKQVVVDSANAQSTLYSFPGPVYSITPGGEVAATANALYETETGNKLLDLGISTAVQVITSDYTRLVYFDPNDHKIKTINLLAAVGGSVLQRNISPPDGAIVLPPAKLSWAPLPGVDRYNVYFGENRTNVSAASTDSPSFLGTVQVDELFLNKTLVPGRTYYWRVDAVTSAEATPGDLFRFTVSTISASTNQVNVSAIQGFKNFRTSLDLASQTPGESWTAAADTPWVSFAPAEGKTPATLNIVLDASKLAVGFNSATITISNATSALFTIPVKLRVEPLTITVLQSDPASEFAYAITENGSSGTSRAYLLEINTRTESVERMLPVGSSATDIAIHNGDNRLYVPNWMSGSLLAINKTTLQLERSFSVPPFAGVGYSSADVYLIAAGAPGRLVVEGEDQWINVSIFDTAAGKFLSTVGEREGGGAFAPGGRYYYHGDDNSSGATVHKLDLLGDKFVELANVRVESGGYYGSRIVLVSEDGKRVYWNGSVFNSDLVEEWKIADIIYSTSADGRYAFGLDNIYDVTQRRAVLGMPASGPISAYNSTTKKLIVPVKGTIQFFNIPDPLSLPTPALSILSSNAASVTLSWTDQSLETGFTLQRRASISNPWENFATPPRNTNQWVVTGLAPETSYEFRIKADAPGVSSDWSDVLVFSTPGNPPTTPVLTSISASTSRVILTWTDPLNETDILLERRFDGAGNFALASKLPAGATNYTDTNVVSGSFYEYRVAASNRWGVSPYSGLRSITVLRPSAPVAPLGLKARANSAHSIQISWIDGLDETGYRIQRRTDDPQSWANIMTLPADALAWTDTNVVSGTEYWYRIVAFNAIGDSPFSNVDSAIPVTLDCLITEHFDPALDPNFWTDISGGWPTGGRGSSMVTRFGSARIQPGPPRPFLCQFTRARLLNSICGPGIRTLMAVNTGTTPKRAKGSCSNTRWRAFLGRSSTASTPPIQPFPIGPSSRSRCPKKLPPRTLSFDGAS
jgi:DNA-binding beta-propeller fold protein YncE